MKLDINNYPGSKGGAGVAEWIINHIPDCSNFIEGFGGSGVITFKLIDNHCRPAKIHLNELYTPVYFQLKTESYKRGIYPPSFLNIQNVDTIELYEKLFSENSEREYSGSVFYFDPPYLMDSRKSQRPLYGHEWDELEHIRFLKLVNKLDNCGARIIISHYNHKLYNSTLSGWKTSTMKTMTRSGPAKEKIYMNYNINDFNLLCTAFVGCDRSARQRVKRKKYALAKKLALLHRHERQAIFDYIKKTLF